VPVDVDGDLAWTLATDVPALARARPSRSVRLLGNFDQYVLGPSKGVGAFLPGERKAQVSRTAGWISRVVLNGGRIAGVWDVDQTDGSISFDLWSDVPQAALARELERLATY
jgi:hypothetical protein